MKYTLLGKSGIEVSRITHGCMELGGGRGMCARIRKTSRC